MASRNNGLVLDLSDVHYITLLKTHLDVECIHAVLLSSVSGVRSEVSGSTAFFHLHNPLVIAAEVSEDELVTSLQFETVDLILLATYRIQLVEEYCRNGVLLVEDESVRTIFTWNRNFFFRSIPSTVIFALVVLFCIRNEVGFLRPSEICGLVCSVIEDNRSERRRESIRIDIFSIYLIGSFRHGFTRPIFINACTFQPNECFNRIPVKFVVEVNSSAIYRHWSSFFIHTEYDETLASGSSKCNLSLFRCIYINSEIPLSCRILQNSKRRVIRHAGIGSQCNLISSNTSK